MDKQAVKAEEQSYFDTAYESRERMRRHLDDISGAGANPGAAAHLRRYAEQAKKAMRDPGSAVAFGRIDTADDDTWYVGYSAIWDAQSEILVVNWQAPVATPFYEANVDDPQGLLLRRGFDTDGNSIVDFDDMVFAVDAEGRVTQVAGPIPGTVADALLDDLERHRTGEMQDIVRTIQQAQYRLVRAPLDRLLVIQGGPGTGKTAVALHRVSWLLFNHREELTAQDVLVIGPNPTFIRYIQKVLPGIGDENVRQSALTGLVSDVRFGASESPSLAKLKGDLRMEPLVDRGLQDRIGVPDEPLTFDVGARTVSLDREELAVRVARLRRLPFTAGRQQLRDYIREEIVRGAGRAPERDGQIDAALDRIWPSLTPQAFLRELYGSERRLVTAAGDDFTAAEVRELYRRAEEKLSEEVWTSADAGVLDYANFTMNGPPASKYSHIVVDEAQDLSPMELAMIRRRSSNGSMTILGDVAQSVGGWARDDWTDVIAALASEAEVVEEELRVGYRVPRQVFEFAAGLLPYIAPQVTPPRIVRDGPSDPTLIHVTQDEVAETTVTAAAEYAARGYPVGVIVPSSLRAALEDALQARKVNWSDARIHGLSGPITLVAPEDSRGLEFDAVVVVEPEAIAAAQLHGHRLLYVALTRSTQYLTVVHGGPALPLPEDDLKSQPPPVRTPAGTGADTVHPQSREERAVEAFAAVLADEIKESLQPSQWRLAAERIRQLLEGGPREPGE